jgi:hypothetical protein
MTDEEKEDEKKYHPVAAVLIELIQFAKAVVTNPWVIGAFLLVFGFLNKTEIMELLRTLAGSTSISWGE